MFCFTSGLALMLCLRYLLSIDNLGLHDFIHVLCFFCQKRHCFEGSSVHVFPGN